LPRSALRRLNRDPDAAFVVAANHQRLLTPCKRGHHGVGETALNCPNRRRRAGSKIGFSSHADLNEATTVPLPVVRKREGKRTQKRRAPIKGEADSDNSLRIRRPRGRGACPPAAA